MYEIPIEELESRISAVIAESERLRSLCAKHKITIKPYVGCTGLQFYEAVSTINGAPVTSVSESKIAAIDDVVWKLENGWGKAS